MEHRAPASVPRAGRLPVPRGPRPAPAAGGTAPNGVSSRKRARLARRVQSRPARRGGLGRPAAGWEQRPVCAAASFLPSRFVLASWSRLCAMRRRRSWRCGGGAVQGQAAGPYGGGGFRHSSWPLAPLLLSGFGSRLWPDPPALVLFRAVRPLSSSGPFGPLSFLRAVRPRASLLRDLASEGCLDEDHPSRPHRP